MRRRTFSLCLLLVLLTASAGRAFAGEITVSAAVSLKEAIPQVGDAYEKSGGEKVNFNFGSSGQLLAQMRQGAPIDLFISAAGKQMDDAISEGLAVAKTRRVVAANTLELIVPAAA